MADFVGFVESKVSVSRALLTIHYLALTASRVRSTERSRLSTLPRLVALPVTSISVTFEVVGDKLVEFGGHIEDLMFKATT